MNQHERDLVVIPLLDQLAGLGWEIVWWGRRSDDDRLGRSTNRVPLFEQRLHDTLLRINPGPDGQAWLDEARLAAAIAELRSMPAGTRLMEANQRATELLHDGFTVAGLDGWDGGRDRVIDYVDWDDWAANEFLAVAELPVAGPGNQPDVRADVTLFVNGIPVVVIEAKSPLGDTGIVGAVDQLRRYANLRGSAIDEGAAQLFFTNQLTIATTGDHAQLGTFNATAEHFAAWKDPYPLTRDELGSRLGKAAGQLTQQEILAAVVLTPERLLDVVRHFTVFDATDGTTVKKVARYQQHRCVHRAIERLLIGATRAENSEVDRRGGIVWHTQGSGKSLTMVFLIRAMRSDPRLRHFKVVLVTDRTDLQSQLKTTAGLTGETVKVAATARKAGELLAVDGPGVVMVMIQKNRDTSGASATATSGITGDESLGTVNDSKSILLIVDEAHRSHASRQHANLMAAVPNAARIGFTGTPIIMGARKKTREIFGGYLDTYTLKESEADGATVPIFYEGRTSETAIKGASRMDGLFAQWFAELTDEQRETLQHRYASVADVLESPELIAAKARDLLRHYVGNVMPAGLKGMVVATSRLACVRYHDALVAARNELVVEIETRAPRLAERPVESLDADEQMIRRAALDLDVLRALEFAPVISAGTNDLPQFSAWTDGTEQANCIGRFKKPLGTADDATTSPLALLIVKSMLLTGFDAPIAQVLYLDRMIQEAELLQAIARVNRTRAAKNHGLVVDYFGIANQLSVALAAYTGDGDDPDIDGALRPLQAEIDQLEPRRQRVRQLFVQQGVDPGLDNLDDCVLLLDDERLRAQFDIGLERFLDTFDIVLPRPAALPFAEDAALFGQIQMLTRRRYRDTVDGDFDPKVYKESVRRLLDQHIVALDLSARIPSIRITDPSFLAHVRGLSSDQTKASEMEHALRHHIREHLDEDPAYYERFSERVREILDRLDGRWDQLVLALEPLTAEATAGRQDDDETGLDPMVELPFFHLLSRFADVGGVVSTVRPGIPMVRVTLDMLEELRRQTSIAGFWDNQTKQDDVRRRMKRRLDDSDLFEFGRLDQLAVELMDLAHTHRHRLATDR